MTRAMPGSYIIFVTCLMAAFVPWILASAPPGSRGTIDFRYPDIIVKPRVPCPSEGVFPHPRNCTWYYRCYDRLGLGYYWRAYFECEPGTVFSDELDQCVFPHMVPYPCNGADGPSPPIPATFQTTTEDLKPPEASTTTTPQSPPLTEPYFPPITIPQPTIATETPTEEPTTTKESTKELPPPPSPPPSPSPPSPSPPSPTTTTEKPTEEPTTTEVPTTTTMTTTTTATSTSTTTAAPTTFTYLDEVLCIVSDDKNCSNYLDCSSQASLELCDAQEKCFFRGILISSGPKCDNGTKYSVETKKCVEHCGEVPPQQETILTTNSPNSFTCSIQKLRPNNKWIRDQFCYDIAICTSDGKFVTMKEYCTDYYECRLENGLWKYDLKQCPVGDLFSFKLDACVPSPPYEERCTFIVRQVATQQENAV